VKLGKWTRLNGDAFTPTTYIMPVRGGYLVAVDGKNVVFFPDDHHLTWEVTK
jgi:roadblock/LC7 domain-containing protein